MTMMIKIALVCVFGLPIAAGCLYFCLAAGRMMEEERERERMRRAAEEARRLDGRRRRAKYIAAGARTGACR